MARTTSVTLGERYEGFVAKLIEEGHFQTVSEAVRAGLSRLETDYEEREAKLEALRKAIEEGRNSPIVEDFDLEKFIEEMKRKYG